MALDILAIAAKLNGLTLPHATGKIAQAREQASVRQSVNRRRLIVSCPNCRQNNIAPVPFVYEQGTVATGGYTVGAGLLGKSVVPFIAGSQSRSQSLFAARLAPPKHPGLSKWCLLWIPLALILLCLALCDIVAFREVASLPSRNVDYKVAVRAAFSTSLLIIVVGVIAFIATRFMVKRTRQLRNEWLQEFDHWQKSKVCLDCGTVF